MSKWKIGGVVLATVGGLGAVLAYSPSKPGGAALTPTAPSGLNGGESSAPAQTPTSTEPSTPVATPTPVESSSRQALPKPPTTTAPKKIKFPAARHTITPPKELVNGTFTGQTSDTQYGPVQVQIDVVNSKIVAARALQLPSGTPNDIKLNKLAVPYLIQETIQASTADFQGVGGASYTSQGWYDSLVSALSAAGL